MSKVTDRQHCFGHSSFLTLPDAGVGKGRETPATRTHNELPPNSLVKDLSDADDREGNDAALH